MEFRLSNLLSFIILFFLTVWNQSFGGLKGDEIGMVVNLTRKIKPQYGIYSTTWTAHSKNIRKLIDLVERTEINAIFIDVKEDGVFLDKTVKNLVDELHQKNIYAAARIVLFKDSSQAKSHPDWYFKKSDGAIWQDARGWRWFDPSIKEVQDYNIAIAKKALDWGFDEINFDYIRWPAFKNDDDVYILGEKSVVKLEVINDFARRLTSELKSYDPEVILSVDLFAYNMLKSDDLGIGQKFVDLYDYFDYVSPMIYPSHYSSGNWGYQNPAQFPYEVVLKTIESAKSQLRKKVISDVGTSTPALVEPLFEEKLKKLRPWLQNFNIGAVYDAKMVELEKKALRDAGLTSGWLLWNSNNVYNEKALEKLEYE